MLFKKGGTARHRPFVTVGSRGTFFRVGKVSIEEILEACFRKSMIMRTRPRPSDIVARLWGCVALPTRRYEKEKGEKEL